MPTPSLIGRIAGALSARATISRLLVEMGEPPAGMLEGVDAIRKRYRAALNRHHPLPNPCDAWEDEIPEDAEACPTCGAEPFMHASRCGVDCFDPAPENPNKCDACSRTEAEHKPGARPETRDT